MVDITMCNDENCPRCFLCFRFAAKPDAYSQSYFEISPRKDGCCDAFIEVEKYSDSTDK